MMDRIPTQEAEDLFRGSQVIGATGLNEVKAAFLGAESYRPL
jgi:hypothetical protein